MTKLLLIVAFTIVVVLWFKHQAGRRDELPRSEKAPEDMVRCAHCGVHLPRSECHVGDEKFFCSEEHFRLHR